MNIEILLTENEIAQEFSEAMQARDLPEKFFYWFPLSVRAWLALAQDSENDGLRRSWNALSGKAKSIVDHFDCPVPLVSLGAGDGFKDRLLLDGLKAAGCEVNYFPVDASQSLLEVACAAAEDAEIETRGIKADISSPMHLMLASDAAESPKLFLMAGNTLGLFDPLDQIRHVASCLHEGDRLIVDGEIYQETAPVDSPLKRKFRFAPLASIGITEDDGDLRFEHKLDQRHQGLHVITKHFRADRDLRLTVSAETIMVERGERVSMNFHYMYSPEAFRWLLQDQGKLHIVEEISSPDGKFVTAVCAR